MLIETELMEYFLDFSVVVTGFSRFDLLGTGQASLYFETVWTMIGDEVFYDLLQTFHNLQEKATNESSPSILTEGLHTEILESGKRGPVARNIIKLWYTATWEELPSLWQHWYGTGQENKTFIPSPHSYPEGLVWKAVGVNPAGAKAPGYGTWSEPPSVSLS